MNSIFQNEKVSSVTLIKKKSADPSVVKISIINLIYLIFLYFESSPVVVDIPL